MIASRVSATLILISVSVVSVSGQRPMRGINPNRTSRLSAEEHDLVMRRRVYDMSLARGDHKNAGVAARQLALAFERRSDFANAATWWQTAYTNGNTDGLLYFLNLVLTKKVSVSNPDSIRPLIEVRAYCGSQMARAYALEHWHETPSQLPDFYGQTNTPLCQPAAPDDHMDQRLLIASRQRHVAERNAQIYKLHPEQDPEVKEQKAVEGAALLLGAVVITAASMPATGPGSIACNKYQNHYPGATDPSVCDTPSSK